MAKHVFLKKNKNTDKNGFALVVNSVFTKKLRLGQHHLEIPLIFEQLRFWFIETKVTFGKKREFVFLF